MTERAGPAEGRLFGAGFVVLAAACFATLGPITRLSAAEGIDPLVLITWRSAVGAAFLAAAVVLLAANGQMERARWSRIRGREGWFLAGGIVAGALVNFGVFLAFVRISIALTLLIFYLYPTLVAVASAVRFGEPFDRYRGAALGASLVGLALVLAGAGDLGRLDVAGLGLAFLAAVSQTVFVLAARHGFPSVPAGQAAIIVLAGMGVVYVGSAAAAGALSSMDGPLASPTALLLVLFAGTVGAGVPTLAYLVGIRRLGPPRAAILATLEPVLGVTFAAVLLAEVPTAIQLAGGALVIVGAVLSQMGGALPAAEHEVVVGGEPMELV